MDKKEFYKKVYDILIEVGGALPTEKENFIDAHVEGWCCEWRFSGKLSFGGKYRKETNTVDCYSEDETAERLRIIKEINEKLKSIRKEDEK